MTRFIIGDLRTGRRILDLPVLSGTWDDRLDVAETIHVTADMKDLDVQALELDSAGTPGKSFLAVVENQTIVAAGPIWASEYNRGERKIDIDASGLLSYFDHRYVEPLLALTADVTTFTVPDPTDNTKQIANPALSSTFVGTTTNGAYTGLSLGTIAKRLVQQAQTFTGGNVPIVFQADENTSNSDHQRTYLGVDFKKVSEALSDLIDVIGGPEINFAPRFTADMLGIEWVMQTGTVAQPMITSATVQLLDVTAPLSQVSGLTIKKDASNLAALNWATGGRQADKVLVARGYTSRLVDAGYPLLESLDTTHTSVSLQPTLDSYAQQNVLVNNRPQQTWAFNLQAYPVDELGMVTGVQVGSYNVGDFVDLYLTPYDRTTGIGDPFIPQGGTFRHRIVGLSGDQDGVVIGVQCAPVIA